MTSSSTPRTSTFSRPRKGLLKAAVLAVFMLLPALARGQDGMVRAYLFYSAACEECHEVMEELLPPLREEYGPSLVIRELDLAIPKNYELLVALEEKCRKSGNAPPVVVVGDTLLGGFDEVRLRLPAAIAEVACNGGCPWPAAARNVKEPSGDRAARVAAFYEFGCKACGRIELILDNVARQYPSAIIERYDTTLRKNKILLEAASGIAGVPGEKRLITPVVFAGKEYLIGGDIGDGALVEIIGAPGSGYDIVSGARPIEGSVSDKIAGRLESFKVMAVVSAGLIDGINPCAFATIVFFISYLTLVGRSRREILVVGVFFTIAVFLSYIAIGLGLFGGIRSLSVFPAIGAAFSYGIGGFAIVLGVLSFVDYLKCRRGKASGMILQLPSAAKKKIHSVIRERSRLRNYVIASLVIGFLVSLIELVCTGQIYLPTIMLVVSGGGFSTRALFLLILYNLAFVLPLAGIVILASSGLSAERLGGVMTRHLAAIKLLSAILFFALGTLIFLL